MEQMYSLKTCPLENQFRQHTELMTNNIALFSLNLLYFLLGSWVALQLVKLVTVVSMSLLTRFNHVVPQEQVLSKKGL